MMKSLFHKDLDMPLKEKYQMAASYIERDSSINESGAWIRMDEAFFEYDEEVSDELLAIRRRQVLERMIRERPNISAKLDLQWKPARLLAIKLDRSTRGGETIEETRGFLDINHCPPVNFWVDLVSGHGEQYVVAYIPEEFVGLVESGVLVCIDGVMVWHTDWQTNDDLLQELYKHV
jgi:hypothetical protein